MFTTPETERSKNLRSYLGGQYDLAEIVRNSKKFGKSSLSFDICDAEGISGSGGEFQEI